MKLSEIAFSSESRYKYIDIKDHSDFTTSGGSPNGATVTIAHSLGYIPFFRTFFKFSDDANYYAGFNGPGLILGNWEINNINADTADLNITIQNNTGSATAGTVYYRIYAEPQI